MWRLDHAEAYGYLLPAHSLSVNRYGIRRHTVTFRIYYIRNLRVFLALDELCCKEYSQCLLILVAVQKIFHSCLVNNNIDSNLVYHCSVCH